MKLMIITCLVDVYDKCPLCGKECIGSAGERVFHGSNIHVHVRCVECSYEWEATGTPVLTCSGVSRREIKP